MMRKTLSIISAPFLLLLLVAKFYPAQAAGNINLFISPVTYSTTIGGAAFTLNINANTGTDRLTGAKIRLSFDTSKLKAESATFGNNMLTELRQPELNNTAGTVSIDAGTHQPTNPPTGPDVNVAKITFRAIGTGTTQISFAAGNETVSLGKTGNTLNTATGATVNITGSQAMNAPIPDATPVKSPSATNAPAVSPGALSGRVTINFDNTQGQDRVLTGQYPNGLVNWGNGFWYLSSPWQEFNTKSVSFNGPADISEAVFNILQPGHLESLQAYNGGSLPSAVTLGCLGQPTRAVTVNQGIAPTTIQTGWTGNCQQITISSSNGWDTNFDNLVLADPNVNPVVIPQPTINPIIAPLPTGEMTINFDNLNFQNRNLKGQYPTGVIDWGVNKWFLSSPWKQFTTKSVSFNQAGVTSRSFKFVIPKTLIRVKVFNGGLASANVRLSCEGQPTKSFNVASYQVADLDTGWSIPCTTVIVRSSGGWDVNLDDLVIR